jgi:2-polyprenyl-6-methoxyphenol hydroxylase-like FAD-dependent oxidoreductase
MGQEIEDRAVVLGASIAGLLAARVLADVYPEVTVVDRDELPANSAPRRGVPQGRHIHALLARGLQIMEGLFPGLTAELVSQGVPTGDLLGDTRWYFDGHRLPQIGIGLLALSASRPFLEASIRARLRALPTVAFVEACDVVGLVYEPNNRRVTGARVLRRTDGSAEEVLGADLVVDALGRGSRTSVWLDALGCERPEEERVQIGLGYSTRIYRARQGALDGDLAIVAPPTPGRPRGGALARIEGNRWMLTLAGVLGDYPPRDVEGYLAFARSLQLPDIYETIRDADPLEDPVAYRFPASVRHRYERLARFPDGIIVMGDALCSFNPIYGQGMSVAALEALTLRRHLERGVKLQPRSFFRDVARLIDVPWDIATGGDFAFPGVEGRRTRKIRMVNAYMARLLDAATHDVTLSQAFMRVTGLVDRPGKLLNPSVAARVLRGTLRRKEAVTDFIGDAPGDVEVATEETVMTVQN